jgi:hypothetical protein
MSPGVLAEPGITGLFGSVDSGGFRPVPEDESGLAARAENATKNIDNKRVIVLLCIVLLMTKPKIVLTWVYGHHEFPLVSTQVCT